jgi:hypothetical protein
MNVVPDVVLRRMPHTCRKSSLRLAPNGVKAVGELLPEAIGTRLSSRYGIGSP